MRCVIISVMNIYTFYVLNILLFAIPLALFEISVEKAHGWGSGWSKDKWYAKSFLKGTKVGDFLTKVTKLEPPLNYHIILAYMVFPAVSLLEYFYGSRNIYLIIANLFGAILWADVTWFSCNWYFDSMTQLLKGPYGSIFWHKAWIRVYKQYYIPRAYIVWLVVSLVFLYLATILG